MAEERDLTKIPDFVLRDMWIDSTISHEEFIEESRRRREERNNMAARQKLLEAALIKMGMAFVEKAELIDGVEPQVFVDKIVNDKRHPDDKAVDCFVAAMGEAMKSKLAKKRDEGYTQWWDKYNFPWEVLIKNFLSHIQKGDPVDVANYCMFLYHRGEGTNGAELRPAVK